MMVDEADIDLVGGNSGNSSPMRGQKRMLDSPVGSPKAKRKPGPLPKDFPVWRPQSPSPLSPTLNNIPPESHIIPITASNDTDDDIYIIEKERHGPPHSKFNAIFLINIQKNYFFAVLYILLIKIKFMSLIFDAMTNSIIIKFKIILKKKRYFINKQ